LQGANVAGDVSGGVLPSVSKLDLSGDYWSSWQPGYGEAASRLSDGGLKDLLDARDQTIKGIDNTTMERLGNVIADGVGRGDSIDTIAKAASAIITDPARASLIADTEMGRGMVAASMDTYAANGVPQKEWLAEGDCCDDCQENVDASPLALDDEWPAGDFPVHPGDRCAVGPAGM
jgi:hypothetical protein